MKRIVILGSTGSIGTQTLDVIRAHPGEFQVIGLSAHENAEVFERQMREFQPKYVLQTAVSENPSQALASLASSEDADLVVNAVSGSAGLTPAYAAVKAGKNLALANKESLVMAGELIMQTAAQTGAQIFPIDSEPSAIWQILGYTGRQPVNNVNENSRLKPRTAGPRGRNEVGSCGPQPNECSRNKIAKIILTASGGPFWKWRKEELMHVTKEQALKHPTWKMGEKVSIDSATLMNKAFEIMEARWLFDVPPEKIDVTIHRQSVVHAMVQFCDGNTAAILSTPDMKIPIAHALFYPNRPVTTFPHLDFAKLDLTFEKPDYSIFEGPKLAYEILAAGGMMPAVFCLADEIAVSKFLAGEIPFLGIYDVIKRALETVKNNACSLEAIEEVRRSLL